MTPEQAHNLLIQATGLLQLKREEHQAVLQALDVLKPTQEPIQEEKPKNK